jgi:tRNA (cmo5U34)-methyltransferase
MLERAEIRVKAATSGNVQTIQSDMSLLSFAPGSFDIILAGQVFHHLRDDAQWQRMFTRLYEWLRPSGALFVADFVAFDDPGIQALMMTRYADHLESFGGAEYRDRVLAYCDAEDSPRSVRYQFELLRAVGFSDFDVLHKNALFAAYYARK